MKKRAEILSLFMAVIMILCCFPISVVADSFVIAGDNFEYVLNEEGTYTITGYDGEDEILEIPAYIDGVAVTELSSYSLYNDIVGYKLIIPETIKKIGGSALTCNNLTEIEVHPDNEFFCDVDGVIYNKDVSMLIYYPEGREELSYTVPSTVTELGEYSFHYGGKLEKIELPEGIKKIGKRAFYYVDTLKEINLPEGLESIASGAFMGCSEIGEIHIPDSVKAIETQTFSDCSGLRNVYIGSSVESIGIEIFLSCSSLVNISVSEDNKILCAENGVLFNKDKTELIKYPSEKSDKTYAVPATVTKIQKQAFDTVDFLEEITFPDSLETIEEGNFFRCQELKSVEIPDSVKYMGYCFSWCPKLERVFVGKNVEIFAPYSTFAYCDLLVSIEVDEDNPYYSSLDGVLYNKDISKTLKFPKGLSTSEYKIPASVRELDGSAFADQEGYSDELWENGEVYVDDCLLEYDYHGKGNVNVKTGVRVIGVRAFWAEQEIWGVSLPDTTRIIGSMAFSSMMYLQAVYIPESVNYMGNDVFFASDMCYDIYYGGSEQQWSRIENIENAGIPEDATVHFQSEGNDFVNPVLPEDMYENSYVDEESGISVFTDTDAQLSAENITSEEIVASVDELLPKATVEAVYEINLHRDGEEIQPEDVVLVKIPTNNRFARVYRMEEDGTLTDMNARYEGGYLVFTTSHFSLYTLAQKNADEYERGDVDMDETVNVRDATMVQKYLASLTELEQGVLDHLADFDESLEVTVRDATAIQKFVAGLL
ncbi:MAG: leucine-rich repeat protein [Clostridia bacterium]|nr:leucine-rich repeat protein [Clostridia bacterium]